MQDLEDKDEVAKNAVLFILEKTTGTTMLRGRFKIYRNSVVF
jgi:hypothetical protein